MKRTMIAAVIGGFMALCAGLVTAQAAPIAAIQAGKSAQAGEPLAQKAGWRHRERHYRHRHWRHRPVVRWHFYRAPRRYVRHHYRHHQPSYRHWSYRDHRRHYH